MARNLRLKEATFSITSVIPGTYLHDKIDGDSRYRVVSDVEPDYYNSRNFADRRSRVSQTMVKAFQLLGIASFYLHPFRADYIARHFLSIAGLKRLFMKSERFLK
jgi:hypothetical protein